jgi:hypothetical protein
MLSTDNLSVGREGSGVLRLLPTCELAASNSSFPLLTKAKYPHKTAEKLLFTLYLSRCTQKRERLERVS